MSLIDNSLKQRKQSFLSNHTSTALLENISSIKQTDSPLSEEVTTTLPPHEVNSTTPNGKQQGTTRGTAVSPIAPQQPNGERSYTALLASEKVYINQVNAALKTIELFRTQYPQSTNNNNNNENNNKNQFEQSRENAMRLLYYNNMVRQSKVGHRLEQTRLLYIAMLKEPNGRYGKENHLPIPSNRGLGKTPPSGLSSSCNSFRLARQGEKEDLRHHLNNHNRIQQSPVSTEEAVKEAERALTLLTTVKALRKETEKLTLYLLYNCDEMHCWERPADPTDTDEVPSLFKDLFVVDQNSDSDLHDHTNPECRHLWQNHLHNLNQTLDNNNSNHHNDNGDKLRSLQKSFGELFLDVEAHRGREVRLPPPPPLPLLLHLYSFRENYMNELKLKKNHLNIEFINESVLKQFDKNLNSISNRLKNVSLRRKKEKEKITNNILTLYRVDQSTLDQYNQSVSSSGNPFGGLDQTLVDKNNNTLAYPAASPVVEVPVTPLLLSQRTRPFYDASTPLSGSKLNDGDWSSKEESVNPPQQESKQNHNWNDDLRCMLIDQATAPTTTTQAATVTPPVGNIAKDVAALRSVVEKVHHVDQHLPQSTRKETQGTPPVQPTVTNHRETPLDSPTGVSDSGSSSYYYSEEEEEVPVDTTVDSGKPPHSAPVVEERREESSPTSSTPEIEIKPVQLEKKRKNKFASLLSSLFSCTSRKKDVL
ncbi:hypothetical protein AGDE_13929 [Angomonas deanei]|uniref:Uncharacterized protein n=1 Tax=Angomonas deanei TaxID=59799 RepID=A0A7G2CJJ4_9TRYP|nr:hypothetical protein AGDE_13929 [Angomonas deanei]CAD2220038.1 hypothetical protein, conserved [Angomonas deanei]|eukprot:EPY21596.1 hypothetical protein AGDE_13929 [Angomonas deanei]